MRAALPSEQWSYPRSNVLGTLRVGRSQRTLHFNAHYDVVHAGARVDAPDQHLEPLPLLTRDGVLAMAVPAQPAGLPA